MLITTNRLIIRRFRESDAPYLFAYLSNPRTPCFFADRLASLADARQKAITLSADVSAFAVCLQEDDRLIGHLFADDKDQEEDTWCVGWHFNPAWEGKGFATEAASALFDHLFSSRGARRLYAYVEVYNLASQKLCERLHMRREGCFKEFVSFTSENGEKRYDDTYVYAILSKEWIFSALDTE